LASTKGKHSFVRELLAHGADPNAEDSVFIIYLLLSNLTFFYELNLIYLKDNWTALVCAAKGNHPTICVELLNHGANIEHREMVINLYLIKDSISITQSIYNLCIGRMDIPYVGML